MQTGRDLFLGFLFIIAAFATGDAIRAETPSTRPVEGLRKDTPQVYALTGARIVVSPGQTIEKGTLVVRDGRIKAVGADVKPPADARVVDLAGKTIYPGLIDAYGETSLDTGLIKDGAPYWNSEVTPQLSVADRYKADAALNTKLRNQGVTTRLIAPTGRIIKGTSALISTGDAGNERSIMRDDVALHIRLTVSPGRSRKQYPNSPMGAVALARQAMYDAQWYAKANAAAQADGTLPRPERNDALEVLKHYPDSDRLIIVDAHNELFCLRADLYAREFTLRIAIRGSGYEYRRLEAIQKTGRAVIVPVEFPNPPNVSTAEAARNVALEQMLHWDIAPENPARLHRAGVPIALTSHGLSDQGKFLAAVRTAVKRGLPADAALSALTTTPARLLGVVGQVGTLQAGKTANLVVTDGDLFDDKTKVLATWVDGRQYEIAKRPPLDVRGDWQVTLTGGRTGPLLMKLSGKPEKLQGTIHLQKGKADVSTKLTHVGVIDGRVSSTFDGKFLDREGVVRLTAVVSAPQQGETIWLGSVAWPDGTSTALSAKRVEEKATAKKKDKPKEDAEKNSEKKAETKTDTASFPVNYPLGAWGRDQTPEQPKLALFTNATVWTCGKQGILKNASVLIGNGKILVVGTDIKRPAGAVVIDCKGKHISPGIIDCHSHMATDGGVNESTQSVTAEVRIGDFIDADDVNIYRQLAGGVTSSNILHGSANAIGGQNQVIKLRWGALPEQMKFAEAPEGIKFALGENVKQSNWGDDYRTRYPQTRMGVEQIVLDRFQAALHYREQWQRWRKTHKGLPPRRDLELDALDEILRGKRWIHCHSYRQDEILALIRTLDAFGVQIGTFQHILEGYKVADAMARHGAMGSAFSDWWAYKFEVYDAIPYNGTLMHNAGVVVSFNSDDRELARHLNHEAAKAVKYGDVSPVEALKFVTLNPAKQLRIDQYVGSLEVGKHADLVVWSSSPLSNFSRCEQTWVDGRKYFDRTLDQRRREQVTKMRASLVQKILNSGQPMRPVGAKDKDPSGYWPRTDIFCTTHKRQKNR